LQLSLKGGVEGKRLFGKNHTKTAYSFFEKIKTKHRFKMEEERWKSERNVKKKEESEADKLGGVNHFDIQELDSDFRHIRKLYAEMYEKALKVEEPKPIALTPEELEKKMS
jgi:hypothetical protein